jgi:hypothetical protein
MNIPNKICSNIFSFALFISASAATISAQKPNVPGAKQVVDTSGDMPWLTIALVVIGVVAVGFLIWRRMSSSSDSSAPGYDRRRGGRRSTDNEDGHVDAAMEFEWFRKKTRKASSEADSRDRTNRSAPKRSSANGAESRGVGNLPDLSSRQFQERMKELQYAHLPIHSFVKLADARPYDQLPISSDPSLLDAIEQANEEFEEDEAIRELAVKILAAFKTRNSVEALSQIALYDLSVTVRSKAIATLTEFDHESVFETILLACADPTLEVRAVAARGLFRLSFDRADAWKRLLATDDKFKMTQAVRAATEAGIVQKSFDRLINDDMRAAYEAFALTSLVVRSGEAGMVFDAIRDHRDERVKLALLHVLRVMRDDDTLKYLDTYLTENKMPVDVANQIAGAIAGVLAVAV